MSILRYKSQNEAEKALSVISLIFSSAGYILNPIGKDWMLMERTSSI